MTDATQNPQNKFTQITLPQAFAWNEIRLTLRLTMIESAKSILKSVFGYEQFIFLQQEVIENVLRRKDCLVVVPVQQSCPHTYQSENHFTGAGRWRSDGIFPFSQMSLLCDDADRLWINGYHSHSGINDRMPEKLTSDTLSSSLLFIRPDDLCMTVGAGPKGLKKVRAKFTYRDERYWLTVTDPAIEAEYIERENGEYPVGCSQTYLTVSISEPFEGFCYKLVAAVLTIS